jgi:hypothetical protein
MQLLSELTYATALEKNRIGSTTDRVAKRGLIKTIDQLLPESRETQADAPPRVQPDTMIETASPHTTTADIIADIQAMQRAQPPGSVSITLIGVNYRSADDHARAHSIISAIRADTLHPTLMVFERDLDYGAAHINCPMIHEESLTTSREGNFGRGLTHAQRCMVVAGYVHLCLAAGDQAGIDHVMLFFDAHQAGILSEFKYLLANIPASPIKTRPYTLLTVGASR